MSGGGTGREGDTKSEVVQAPSCQPWADAGLDLMNLQIMTWAEFEWLTDGATQEPLDMLNFENNGIMEIVNIELEVNGCVLQGEWPNSMTTHP